MLVQTIAGLGLVLSFVTMSNTTFVSAASNFTNSERLVFSPNHQKLTVHVDNVPLREVLQELSDRLAVTVTLMGFTGDMPLSTTFTDLPLEQGLEKLLQGKDYALLHRSTAPSLNTQLKEIIVLPRLDSSSSSQAAETRVVMSPKNDLPPSSTNQNLSAFNTSEGREFAPKELAKQVEELVQLIEGNQSSSDSPLTISANELSSEVRKLSSALLGREPQSEKF